MKIIGYSDIITNSSSEVFVMEKEYAEYYNNLENTDGCIDIELIDLDWILNGWEQEAIIDLCDLDKSEVFTFVKEDSGKILLLRIGKLS